MEKILKDFNQISFLILSKFKLISELLIPLKKTEKNGFPMISEGIDVN